MGRGEETIEPKNDGSIGESKQKRSSHPATTRTLRYGDEMGGRAERVEPEDQGRTPSRTLPSAEILLSASVTYRLIFL